MARFVDGPKCRNAAATHLGGNRQKIAENRARKVGNSARLISGARVARVPQAARLARRAIYTFGDLSETAEKLPFFR
jgi:hypothetical protein